MSALENQANEEAYRADAEEVNDIINEEDQEDN